MASVVSSTQHETVSRHKESLCYLQDQYAIQSSHCEKRYGDALAQIDALNVELDQERTRHRQAAEAMQREAVLSTRTIRRIA